MGDVYSVDLAKQPGLAGVRGVSQVPSVRRGNERHAPSAVIVTACWVGCASKCVRWYTRFKTTSGQATSVVLSLFRLMFYYECYISTAKINNATLIPFSLFLGGRAGPMYVVCINCRDVLKGMVLNWVSYSVAHRIASCLYQYCCVHVIFRRTWLLTFHTALPLGPYLYRILCTACYTYTQVFCRWKSRSFQS